MTLRRSAAPLLGVLAAGCLFRLGNAFAAVALPWLVLDLSGSGLWAGAIASASLIALVIGAFFGGALIDRHGARRVAIIAGLASAVCVGAVPAIVQLGPEALPFIAVLVAAGALLDSYQKARGAAVRRAVLEALVHLGMSTALPLLESLRGVDAALVPEIEQWRAALQSGLQEWSLVQREKQRLAAARDGATQR